MYAASDMKVRMLQAIERELAQLPVVADDVFAAFFLPLNQLIIRQIAPSSI
jgi:hypothetical protein